MLRVEPIHPLFDLGISESSLIYGSHFGGVTLTAVYAMTSLHTQTLHSLNVEAR